MSMISSGTRVTHAPIKKCTAMGREGERIVCERSWRAVVLSPATEMLRHPIRVTSFRIYWLSIEHRLDYIRLFLAERHKRIRAQTQDCT